MTLNAQTLAAKLSCLADCEVQQLTYHFTSHDLLHPWDAGGLKLPQALRRQAELAEEVSQLHSIFQALIQALPCSTGMPGIALAT